MTNKIVFQEFIVKILLDYIKTIILFLKKLVIQQINTMEEKNMK